MAYSRVLKRRIRSPYLDIIQAQAPYARQAKYLEEERALAGEGLEIQREDLGLRREGLEQQGLEARDRLALEREGMELGASQAEKAQQIQMVQTAGLGAYAGHKIYKGLAGPEPTAPVAPTGPNLPVTTERGMIPMGPGTTGTSAVTPAPATVFAPTETGALPVKTVGGTVMMEPGVAAPGTAALATPGGAAAMPGIQTTGVAPGGAGTLETVGGETAGAGLNLGPAVKAAGGVLAIEGAHQLGRGFAPKIAEAMPGGEKEWRKGMGLAARTGQGAVIGSVVPGVGTLAGAGVGLGLGVLEAAKETVYDIPVVGKVAEEVGNVLEDTLSFVTGGGCITYTYFYGPHSREKRYARIFCARFMTKERYLGYIAAGTKVIDLAKRHPWLRDTLKHAMPEPYFRYMLYKLKGGKLSIRDRIAAAILNKWFDWEAERLGENIVIKDNLRSCYYNAGSRGGA